MGWWQCGTGKDPDTEKLYNRTKLREGQGQNAGARSDGEERTRVREGGAKEMCDGACWYCQYSKGK